MHMDIYVHINMHIAHLGVDRCINKDAERTVVMDEGRMQHHRRRARKTAFLEHAGRAIGKLCVCVCVCVCACVCVCVCMYMYVCMYVCMYKDR